MKREKEIGIPRYKMFLMSVAITSILLSSGVNEVHAVTESIAGQTDTEELVEESIFASGNHGIDWRLTTDGILYLGEGTMKEMDGQYGNNYPWTQTAGTIKKVVIEGDVVLPEHPKLFMNCLLYTSPSPRD